MSRFTDSQVKRKKLYHKVHDIMFEKGRLSLNALCELVSDDIGSVSVARSKVLRELDPK